MAQQTPKLWRRADPTQLAAYSDVGATLRRHLKRLATRRALLQSGEDGAVHEDGVSREQFAALILEEVDKGATRDDSHLQHGTRGRAPAVLE